MSVEYSCDGCGKREPGEKDGSKPRLWFQRTDEDGTQHSCSRSCIDATAKKTGKTACVLPW